MTLPFLNLSSSLPYEMPNLEKRISFLSFENEPWRILCACAVVIGGSDSWTRDQNVVLYRLLMCAGIKEASHQSQSGWH